MFLHAETYAHLGILNKGVLPLLLHITIFLFIKAQERHGKGERYYDRYNAT